MNAAGVLKEIVDYAAAFGLPSPIAVIEHVGDAEWYIQVRCDNPKTGVPVYTETRYRVVNHLTFAHRTLMLGRTAVEMLHARIETRH